MQAEEAVQIVQRRRADRAQRQRAARRRIILVAMRRHGGEAVERAAQDHHHEAPVGRHAGEGKAQRRVPQRQRAGGGHGLQDRAACGHVTHLRWNSGLESSSARASPGFRRCAIAVFVAAASSGPDARLRDRRRRRSPAACAAHLLRPFDARQHRVGSRPGIGRVRPAFRRRRRHGNSPISRVAAIAPRTCLSALSPLGRSSRR